MIWPIFEVECLTDDEFAKDLEPTKREIKFFCSTIFYMTFLPSVFLLILKTIPYGKISVLNTSI